MEKELFYFRACHINSRRTSEHFGADAADYDGDGSADVAVFRPSAGAWYLNRSQAGFTGVSFGASEDRPVPNAFVP